MTGRNINGPSGAMHADTSPAGNTTRLLARGYQGAVSVIETADGRFIVKEAMGAWPLRALRRAMLRREHAVYQRLQGIPGVPRCHGLHDGHRLLLEYVDGPSLREVHLAPTDRDQFFAALLAVIQAVHRAGVAHADLKRKDNVLVGPGGVPVLIDFGSAVIDGRGLLRRMLFRQAVRMDLNAWVKLKYRRRYDQIATADRDYYRPTALEQLARLVRETWRRLTGRRWRKARRGR